MALDPPLQRRGRGKAAIAEVVVPVAPAVPVVPAAAEVVLAAVVDAVALVADRVVGLAAAGAQASATTWRLACRY